MLEMQTTHKKNKMTKNNLYLIGEIRNGITRDKFIQAKSVDGLKKKINQWIDGIIHEQNKIKR
jgi:hypothetical protein